MKSTRFYVIGLVGLFACAGLAQANPFPAGYTAYEYNGHWYALTLGYGTWLECENEAVSLDAHLVSINDAQEDQWLFSVFEPIGGPVYTAWIGLYQDVDDPAYSEPSGGWKWASGEPFVYDNWEGLEPNNQQQEDFAVLEKSLEWNDFGPTSLQYAPHPVIIEVVPEPATMSLLALSGIALLKRRKH